MVAFLEKIEPSVEKHLSLIVENLPHFDDHSIEHSQSVLKIMESIINEKYENFSYVELFLLYSSTLLHDCGMHLSCYETNVLSLCEKQYGNIMINCLDLSNNKLSNQKLKEWIKENRNYIYNNLLNNNEYINEFVFGFDREDELVQHLSKIAKMYIEFLSRSSYSSEQNNDNKLQQNFIRLNHAWFSMVYCNNLKRYFNKNVLFNYSEVLLEMIGNICLSHTLSLVDSNKLLNNNIRLWDNTSPDLKLISALLRLADYIHLDCHRAPISLSYEKGTNNNSHWTMKATGLRFNVNNSGEELYISVNAPCKKPEEYYFIKSFLPEIQQEICNYNDCIKTKKLSYIKREIDTEGLKSVSEEFIPKDNLFISIQKQQLFRLLMSEELYNDKWACLRELYQNSLDACKCVYAFNKEYKGIIKFGKGSCQKLGLEREYVFCLDNGIGMDEYVITNYLLYVGKSYYSSEDFYNMFIYNKRFNPVSKFGIGIWSSFMTADIIEITTKKEDGDYICITIIAGEGYVFFSDPLQGDKDSIDKHGTLVKMFFKKRYNYIR